MERRLGRCKCTPEVIKRITDALRIGHFAKTAAVLGGITEQAFYEWKRRGADGEAPYDIFLEQVQIAEADAQDDLLRTVRQGNTDKGAPHWTAAIRIMEARFPWWNRRDPDHELRSEMLEIERDILKAKLELLRQGKDPDAGEGITVVLPSFTKNE